jgi:hypothetical protein
MRSPCNGVCFVVALRCDCLHMPKSCTLCFLFSALSCRPVLRRRDDTRRHAVVAFFCTRCVSESHVMGATVLRISLFFRPHQDAAVPCICAAFPCIRTAFPCIRAQHWHTRSRHTDKGRIVLAPDRRSVFGEFSKRPRAPGRC